MELMIEEAWILSLDLWTCHPPRLWTCFQLNLNHRLLLNNRRYKMGRPLRSLMNLLKNQNRIHLRWMKSLPSVMFQDL